MIPLPTLVCILVCHFAFTLALGIEPQGSKGSGPDKSKAQQPDKPSLNGKAAEELKKLADHPEVLFFQERRAKAMKDRWYPSYHYLGPDSETGDPNGFSYWNGNWHLFYQYKNPAVPGAGDFALPDKQVSVFWGHAVSPDLIHWTDLPVAFKSRFKGGRCFSGGALVEPDRVLVTYINTARGDEIAEARDPLLLHWTYLGKDPNEPALPFFTRQQDSAVSYSVWDPCLFKRGDRYYLIGGGAKKYLPERSDLFSKESKHPQKPHWTLVSTKDSQFRNWTSHGVVLADDSLSKLYDDGSCNYLWQIGRDKDLLTYFSHMTGSHLMVGKFDEEAMKFLPISRTTMNAGPAGVTPDPHAPGKVILFTFHLSNRPGDSGWTAVYSLPRRYGLDDRDELTVEPAGATDLLRGPMRSLTGTPLRVAHGQEVVFQGIEGNVMEFELEIDPKNARQIELDVLRSPDAKEFTRIELVRGGSRTPFKGGSRWTLRLDDARSAFQDGFGDRGPVSTEFFMFSDDKTFKLRVFLDVTMVEVFVNNKAHLAQRVHPMFPDSRQMSLQADGKVEVLSLKSWPMNSIWPAPQVGR